MADVEYVFTKHKHKWYLISDEYIQLWVSSLTHYCTSAFSQSLRLRRTATFLDLGSALFYQEAIIS